MAGREFVDVGSDILQSLDLRSEVQRVAAMRGVERFDADRIARQKQPVVAGNGQCKHPVEQFDAARPVALIEMQNHFGIRAGVQTADRADGAAAAPGDCRFRR